MITNRFITPSATHHQHSPTTLWLLRLERYKALYHFKFTLHIITANMPSEKKSWFARYCTPPPPINNTSVCPCSSCYNLGGNSHNTGMSYSYPYGYSPSSPASSRSTEPRSSSLRSSSSDSASISSAETVTTTTHIEHVKH